MPISPNASTVWRDYNTDGVPSSGVKKPHKPDIRQWGTAVETAITTVEATVAAADLGVTGVEADIVALDLRVDAVEADITTLSGAITTPGEVYLTKALMDADLVPGADTLAQVTSDPAFQNNEYLWKKVGATTTGSWTQTDIPAPALNNRRLDDLEAEPLLRNGFMGNVNDKYDAIVLKDSADKLVFGVSQEDGTVKVGAWEHKPSLTHHDPYEPGGYPCYISAGDVVVIHDNGVQTIDGGAYTFTACGPGKTFVTASWDKPAMAAASAVQIDRNGEIFAVYGKSLAIGIMADGQSLSVGSRAVGTGMSVNPDPDHIFMPDTGYSSDIRLNLNTAAGTAPTLASGAIAGLVPMESVPGEEAFTTGQSGVETLCYALHYDIMRKLNYAPTLIGFSLGIGGFALADLIKTTQHYTNTQTAITDIKAEALAAGYRFWLPAVYWRHGESDASNASYESQMVTHRSNFNTDTKAITGQASDIWFIMAVPSSFAAGQDDAALAMLALHENQPAGFVLSHPSYMLDYDIYAPGITTDDDYVHLSVRGQQMDGEYAKKAWLKTVFGKSRWEPLRPLTAIRSAANIDVTFNVPVGSLVLDTTTVTERAGTVKGFEFVDDSGSTPAISSVTVLDADTVRITLASTPTGTQASQKVRYALNGHDGVDPFNASEMARGNLRDSDTTRAVFDPSLTLYNWCVPFEKTVTV